ncbi:MAG: aldo/keto reductase [Planctomycetes bacterium]|nr:aldo/keto reductase [Planctomycetota bacterium]
MRVRRRSSEECARTVRYRTFGRLGWQVSEIGLGAAWLAGSRGRTNSLEESVEIVRKALALGVNYIDTARYYGRSEEILGQALQGVTQPCYLATKAGCTPKYFDYTRDAVLRSFEVSLRMLKRKRVDLLQIHEANAATWERLMGPGGALEALHRLKSEGLVRGIGVTGRNPEFLAKLVDSGEFDCVLSYADYDLTTRLARDVLLPVARRRNVAVVLGSPIKGGLLGPERAARLAQAPAELVAKVRRLEAEFAGPRGPLHHVALRYLLSDPDAAVVLSGAATTDEIADVANAAQAGPLGESDLALIRQVQTTAITH